MSIRRNFTHIIISVTVLLVVIFSVQQRSKSTDTDLNVASIQTLPVLLEGRIVPFDTYARKFSYVVAGSEKPFKANSLEFVLKLVRSDNPLDLDIIKIDNHLLKERLEIPTAVKYTSFKHVTSKAELNELQKIYQQKTDQKIPLSPLDEAFERLSEQLNLISDLIQGTALKIYPANRDRYTDWTPAIELEQNRDPAAQSAYASFQKLLHANFHKKQKEFDESVAELKKFAFDRHPLSNTIISNFQNELIYNQYKPFRIAWILYLVALIISSFGRLGRSVTSSGLSLWLMITGFAIHTYGLYLRTIILDRPPVSNMYESVVFVGWAVIFFSFFLLIKKSARHLNHNRVLLTSTLLAATLIMVMADLLPMSSELGMLEAVLRSTYWLTIHVLVIVASYGAFALACALGHIYLIRIFFGTDLKEASMLDISDAIYQTIKIGVILIGAGTILGGVWANESWGRFWGWDPKETWALISFLGYMALLHARKAGWIRDFGLAVGSLIGFLLILMTWYGVNFVLGTGLHSYGFGSGGQNYALSFTIFELSLLTLVFVRLRNPQTLESHIEHDRSE